MSQLENTGLASSFQFGDHPHTPVDDFLLLCVVPCSSILGRFVSPRKRAQRTFELLNLGFKDLPWKAHGPCVDEAGIECNARIEITEDIREWDYGDYEGITSANIRKMRKEQGLDEHWDIWKDGCPGGE